MKKLFVGILMVMVMVVGMVGCAGMQTSTETKIERVIEIQECKKEDIYDFVRMWMAENFRSAKAVIEYEDKETRTIIGNSNIKYPCQNVECLAGNVRTWRTKFTMRVSVKDNKFRITFTNVTYTNPGVWERPLTNAGFAAVKPKLLIFGDKIKLYIEQNSSKKDW